MLKKESRPKVSLISDSEEETKACARSLARKLKAGDIVLLKGQLGSGKTTFVKGLVEAFGVNERNVNSPTFVLMNYYKGKLPVYHFDLYRLEDPGAVDTLELDDYFYGKGISLIEWPERLREQAPQEYFLIEFEHQGEQKRRICISYPLKHQQRYSL